ncbi:MAG: DUF2007 domain-containing protein [Bacteroidales bacterium]|jgi:hypothetical protein|nr:DUF2007 domain-containing protein [Bacteroidales bacterium]MBO7321051.1 DUF2007 domain-containing protein [Bacteroidales bacterium]MBO7764363.1 DUF2007 domain-containing protein [Bacteroidales bacterium]MBQ2242582.1 DUF2007 domain-containing protein [Bacteroidales bacterium]
MKVVETYTNSFSANLAKGLLEEAGIQAYVLDENMGIVAGVFNTDLLPIRLTVDDKDYSEAVKVLAAASSAE